jgi:hypothetical protein
LCHKFNQHNDFYSEEIQVFVQNSWWVGHSLFNYAVSALGLFVLDVVRGFLKDYISKSYCAFAGRV